MTGLKDLFTHLITSFWLRPGTVRRVPFGAQRGLRFELRGPLEKRVSIFYKTYEKAVSEWLDHHVQPGMTVYVVGAHVGVHVLGIAKRLGDDGHVVAFEGWPENFTYLKRNIAINPQLDATIEPVAACVTAESGTIQMAQGAADGKHHIANDAKEEHASGSIEVPAVSLDDYYAENGNPPALILVDVEGHEADVLRGATHLIAEQKPMLILEHHGKADTLRKKLKALGYSLTRSPRHLYATPMS
ncbi:MAG: FkbM family methyltransferase [Anaerolineaceae bacterium]|nr:FkbM family methyltransferase [Anaerolineaceae bacterium]